MVIGEAVGDCLEAELWVCCEAGEDLGVAEETAVVVVGVEEGDVDVAGEAEELGELENALDGSLNWQREDEYVGMRG